MHRKIDQINVSITTNRGCNLRCEHCYIMPHVFKDPTKMSTDQIRLLFDRVDELLEMDANIQEVEWEAIGGETTLMPFEWWEEMMPYMLDRISQVNTRLKTPGSLNFLTNLMIRDERYFDLFNEYAHHPAFCLYTSWEPDTRRFGTNNKLFPKFLANMDKLRVPSLILDVIMTKDVCDLGGQWVVDTFVPHGVTDFSCKMLSPYGSGKAFFGKAMCDFEAMSKFLAEINAAVPEGVTYTPSEEALSSLYRGTSFQCNGNFYYDLSVEPDGRTHFNANQTADEMVDGGLVIELEDPQWARKVVFGNTQEAAGKLGLQYDECHQCEYLRFCNAGWWHYKMDQDLVKPFQAGECAGLKKHWDLKKNEISGSLIDMSLKNHRSAIKAQLTGVRGPAVNLAAIKISEDEITNLDDFLLIEPGGVEIQMTQNDLLGRSVSERLVWYDARKIGVSLSADNALDLPVEELERILRWQTCATFNHVAPLSDETIVRIAEKYPDLMICKLLKDAAALIIGRGSDKTSLASTKDLPSGMIVDSRNDEMFRWILARLAVINALANIVTPRHATAGQDQWISTLIERMEKEAQIAS